LTRSASTPRAAAAVVRLTTVRDFEAGFGHPSASDLAAMQAALEWAGVGLIGDHGVMLRKGTP
jgi:hypothetical protein